MVRSSIATMRSPRLSKRSMTVPVRPRLTVSGLSRTRVRSAEASDMGQTLLKGFALRPLAVDPGPHEPRACVEREEHRAEAEHHGNNDAQGDRGELHHPPERATPGRTHASGGDEAGEGEPEADDERGDGVDVGEAEHHRRGQEEHDRLEEEHPRAARALDATHGDQSFRRRRSVRASPTVTTEPVTSTPPEPMDSPREPPVSASVTASVIASSRRGATRTRCSPKRSAAISASSWAGIARSVEFWVHTISDSTGSSSPRKPSTSLSAMAPTTPTRGSKVNESRSASTRAVAPCGLW